MLSNFCQLHTLCLLRAPSLLHPLEHPLRPQAFQEGSDVKCVYSNAVAPASAAAGLRAYLAQRGFSKLQSKSTATLHLIKRSTYTGAAVSYYRRPG